jgi:hypothetical protein
MGTQKKMSLSFELSNSFLISFGFGFGFKFEFELGNVQDLSRSFLAFFYFY